MDYNGYQSMLNQYVQQNAPKQTWDYSAPTDSDQALQQRQADEQTFGGIYQKWLGTLTPDQQSEYHNVVNQNYAKGARRHQMMFAAALAGMGGLGALGAMGAGAEGAGAAAGGTMGAGAEGAGVGGAGMDLFGGGFGADAFGGIGPIAGDLGSYAGFGGAGAGAATSGLGSAWEQYIAPLVKGAGKSVGGNLLNSLITDAAGAYTGNKASGQYNDVINNINSLFAPDSPYAKQMQQALERKDAAAGRNSQYGDRAVQLAAALTQAKANALTSPGYGKLLGQRVTSQNQLPATLIALLQSEDGQDLISRAGGAIGNGISKWFGNDGTSVNPASPNTGTGNWWDSFDMNGPG